MSSKTSTKAKMSKVPLASLARQYIADLRLRNLSEHTLRTYQTSNSQFEYDAGSGDRKRSGQTFVAGQLLSPAGARQPVNVTGAESKTDARLQVGDV